MNISGAALPRPAWWTVLPPWGAMMCATGWVASEAGGRSNPWNAHPVVPLLLSAGIAAMALGWRAPWRDREQQVLLALLATLAAWQACVTLGSERALPAGEWRTIERVSALGIAACAVSGAADPASFLRHATAMAVTACGLVVLAWAWQGVPPPQALNSAFGFGGINVVLTVAVPALLGGAAWQWALHRLGRRVSLAQVALCVAGTALVAVISVVLQRRGPLAAIGAVLLAAGAGWARRRSCRVTVLLTLLALGALAGGLAWCSTDPDWFARRGLRLWIYLAGARLAWEGMPWGYGDYGALHLQWSGDPNAQWLTQVEWYLHLHNELLDSAANGGMVALLLLMCIVVHVWRRVHACTDPALAAAARALLVAVAVHGLTDNSYGQPVGALWIAAVLGFVLVLPARAAPPWKVPGARWWVFATGPLAAWGALQAAPMALVASDAPLAEHRRVHARRLHPESLRGEVLQRWQRTLPAMMRGHVESALHRLGPSAELPWLHVLALREGDRDFSDSVTRLRSLILFLSAHPFVPEAYRELDSLLQSRPASLPEVPATILRRSAWVGGAAVVPDAEGAPPGTVGALADDWAQAVWYIRRRDSPALLSPLADRLAAAPVRITAVASLRQAIAELRDAQASGLAAPPGFDARWPWLSSTAWRTP